MAQAASSDRHRAHPRHAPAPAMPDDADAVGAHVLHACEEIERGFQVGDRPVVAEFVALHVDVRRLGPPVEDEWSRDHVAVLGVALADGQRETVVLYAGMSDGDVLAHDHAGMRPRAFRLEDEDLHRAALDLDGDDAMCHGILPVRLVANVHPSKKCAARLSAAACLKQPLICIDLSSFRVAWCSVLVAERAACDG